jgi:hypothetical protein
MLTCSLPTTHTQKIDIDIAQFFLHRLSRDGAVKMACPCGITKSLPSSFLQNEAGASKLCWSCGKKPHLKAFPLRYFDQSINAIIFVS